MSRFGKLRAASSVSLKQSFRWEWTVIQVSIDVLLRSPAKFERGSAHSEQFIRQDWTPFPKLLNRWNRRRCQSLLRNGVVDLPHWIVFAGIRGLCVSRWLTNGRLPQNFMILNLAKLWKILLSAVGFLRSANYRRHGVSWEDVCFATASLWLQELPQNSRWDVLWCFATMCFRSKTRHASRLLKCNQYAIVTPCIRHPARLSGVDLSNIRQLKEVVFQKAYVRLFVRKWKPTKAESLRRNQPPAVYERYRRRSDGSALRRRSALCGGVSQAASAVLPEDS